jgi:uncharacterized protein (DUF39 family)
VIIVNNKEEKQKVSISPFRHQLGGATMLKDLLTGTVIDLRSTSDIEVGGNDALILGVGEAR